METLTDSELLGVLKDRIAQQGSARQAAKHIGVDDSLLSLILSGKRQITPAIAKRIGYARVWAPAQETEKK